MSVVEPLALVGDRYRLEERIGSGSSGIVWRATDEVLDRVVAVKVLRGELADDDEARERLRVEARAAASLAVPGVARVYDFGVGESPAGRTAYIVMELADGESLRDVLAREGRLDERRTMDLVAQVALALAAVHEHGIVHRDIKPDNLIIDADGEVRITDFGIARIGDAAPLTQVGMLVGTAQYLSPERARGHAAGAAADVYALGVIAYECVTGTVPFPSESPVAVALAHATEDFPPLPPGTSADVAALVVSMVAKDPSARPTASAVAARARDAAVHARSVVTGKVATRTMPIVDGDLPHIERLRSDTAESRLAVAGSSGGGAGERPRRRRARSALVLGALAVVLVGVLVAALVVKANEPPKPVAIPPVSGMNAADAAAALEAAGLQVQVRERNVANTAKGQVTEQRPASGEVVPPGTTVVLTAATGKVVVLAADHVGVPYTEAKAALEKLGLEVQRGADADAPDSSLTTGISPAGTIAVGSVVVVDVTAPPSSPSTFDSFTEELLNNLPWIGEETANGSD